MGVTAFVFPLRAGTELVAGGRQGHLVGGVLAAVLLGPADAVVVMTAVLVLQCLVFGDGGLLALGANVLDMGGGPPAGGIRAVPPQWRRGRERAARGARGIAAAAFGAWVATAAAAATCAGELALSGVAAPGLLLGSMVAVHAVVGLGEAVITALVLAALTRARPELLSGRAGSPRASSVLVPGLAASLGLALFVGPFACAWPEQAGAGGRAAGPRAVAGAPGGAVGPAGLRDPGPRRRRRVDVAGRGARDARGLRGVPRHRVRSFARAVLPGSRARRPAGPRAEPTCWRSYAEGDSPIHRASAGAKLAVTLGLVVGLALVPVAYAAWTGFALALVLALAVVSRVPLAVFLARLALVQPFVLGVAVLALFQGRGVAVFVALALKSTTCVAAVQHRAATTPSPTCSTPCAAPTCPAHDFSRCSRSCTVTSSCCWRSRGGCVAPAPRGRGTARGGRRGRTSRRSSRRHVRGPERLACGAHRGGHAGAGRVVTAAVELRGLSFHFDDATPALVDVTFAVAAGERVAILGANGAGKSTLLLHLAGILPDHEGSGHGTGEVTILGDARPRHGGRGAKARRPALPGPRRPALLRDGRGGRGVRAEAARSLRGRAAGAGGGLAREGGARGLRAAPAAPAERRGEEAGGPRRGCWRTGRASSPSTSRRAGSIRARAGSSSTCSRGSTRRRSSRPTISRSRPSCARARSCSTPAG